jgi:hypothetical protein
VDRRRTSGCQRVLSLLLPKGSEGVGGCYAYRRPAAADALAQEHEWRPATRGVHPHEVRRDAICAYRSADHFERRMTSQATLERLLEGVRRTV